MNAEKTIDTIDPNGVALAAIQGLNAELEERLTEKDAVIAAHEARIEQLEAQLKQLASRLDE